MKNRIIMLGSSWLQSVNQLYEKEWFKKRKKKKIHIHLGLMNMGIGLTAGKGGPLGELVQWSDVIASLYVMGHNVTISRKKGELKILFGKYLSTSETK